jgi:hypothetical protein
MPYPLPELYSKPRYFNVKGREEMTKGIGSVSRKLSSQLRRKCSNASQNQAHATMTKSSSPAIPAAEIPSTKSSLESNFLIPMETEIVPFGAPDGANENDDISSDVIGQIDEPETISLGAPNSIDEPGNVPSPSNPPSDDEKRSRLFTGMDNMAEAECYNETADVGSTSDLELSNGQRDVIAGNEDDKMYEMLIAG